MIYWDNGKENGNHLGFRSKRLGFGLKGLEVKGFWLSFRGADGV